MSEQDHTDSRDSAAPEAGSREAEIRRREREIWIREGAKPGQEGHHRLQAEREIDQEMPDLSDDPEDVGATPRD